MLKLWRQQAPLCIAACLAMAAGLPGATHAANKERILYSFTCTDGCLSPTGLTMDEAGRMYGVTQQGGPANAGSVFSVTARGKFKTLHEFKGESDGRGPLGRLLLDSAGNLYGTTLAGGDDCDCGTVFKIDGRGRKTTLHRFSGTGGDGASPYGALISDQSGNLYGTTYYGGQGFGTVFKVSAAGETTILYAFSGGADGSNPHAGLVADEVGNLYGTTEWGGADTENCPSGCGTVFELKNGTKEKVLYAFSGNADGSFVVAPLVLDGTGHIYGTTEGGGAYDFGTVFRLSLSGNKTVLYDFFGDADGADPLGGVIIGPDGSLYGTTGEGGTGANTGGDVFRLSRKGEFDVLHSFAGGPDGAQPQGELVMDADGNLYGTTIVGGANNDGIVFRLSK